jgi:hypothetical protein
MCHAVLRFCGYAGFACRPSPVARRLVLYSPYLVPHTPHHFLKLFPTIYLTMNLILTKLLIVH